MTVASNLSSTSEMMSSSFFAIWKLRLRAVCLARRICGLPRRIENLSLFLIRLNGKASGDDLLALIAQVHFQDGGEGDRISPHECVENPLMLAHRLVPTVIGHCCYEPRSANTSADLFVQIL